MIVVTKWILILSRFFPILPAIREKKDKTEPFNLNLHIDLTRN